ncbi:MAG: undecaprenyl-diphosphatase UppP [Anaerolineae bacterium]|nr:undecaprenyl-diphosphatase UppP [Anaerolineae bacterium]
MSLIQALILGILQGATEFLPISSSGHLVLVPWLLGWKPGSLLFDTMVHWGTLAAIFLYFWRDLVHLIVAGLRGLAGRSLDNPDARLAWGIVVGTVPAVVLGLLFKDQFEALFANPRAVSGFLLLTALFLFVSERWSKQERPLREVGLLDALLIGTAQAFAIIPGISRSGATIAAGLGRGLRRETAARYSFLLATPALLGAGFLQLVDAITGGRLNGQGTTLVAGFLAAAVAGYLCIHILLSYLQRGRLYIFAIYCALIGVSGLVLSFVRG